MLRKLLISLALLTVISGASLADETESITLHCPTYLCWQGYDSFIVVRNTTAKEVGVTPGFSFDGQHLVPYTMLYIPAHGTAIWTADQFVDTSQCTSGFMGVELIYLGEPGAIMGSVIVLCQGLPALSFQAPFRDASGDTSKMIHSSLWLGGDYLDFVFLKNTTDSSVDVSLIFYCNGNDYSGGVIPLGPFQPGLLRVDEVFGPDPAGVGGVDLYCSGPAGSIVAVNVAAGVTSGACMVEEMLPGTTSGVPTSYNLFVANGLSYTLSAINTGTMEIEENFASTGDAPNFLGFHLGNLYCVNSTSNNVQAFSPVTGDLLAEIELDVGTNPWAMAFTSGYKAYVTGYNTGEVVVVNLEHNDVRGNISLGENARNPMAACVAEGKLYVSSVNFNISDYSYGQGIITVIDTETDVIVSTIQTTQVNPGTMAYDNQGELYVVCTGDYVSETGVVDVIDVASDQIVSSLAVGGSPFVIEIAASGNAYLGDGMQNKLYKIDTVANQVLIDASAPLHFGSDQSFACGLVSSEANGHLYISSFADDAIYILDYRTDSLLRMVYPVGDGPGALAIMN